MNTSNRLNSPSVITPDGGGEFVILVRKTAGGGKEAALSATSGASLSANGSSSFSYMQGPSKSDQNRIGNATGYQFGMRAGTIHIYKNSGIVATIPIPPKTN